MIFVRLWQILNIFQQAHYSKSYFNYVFKKYHIRYGPLIICFLLCFISKWFILGGYLYLLYPFKFKKKLVITNRVKRIFFISIIIYIPFMFNFYSYYVSLLFLDFVVFISMLILQPYEKHIYKKYVKETTKKLEEYKGIKIAITGSYGKTSFKHYLAQCMNQTTLMTEKSYNTPLGIAISTKKLNDMYDYYICEMGASKKGDITELMDIIKPDITIVTSIGPQHLKTFKTIEAIVYEKMQAVELLDYGRTTFINADNSLIKEYMIKTRALVITYGKQGDYHYENHDEGINVFYKDLFLGYFPTKLKGKYNYENIVGVIAVLDYLGMDIKIIKEKIYHLEAVLNRQSIRKHDDYIIIDDSFNANIYGAKDALKKLERKNKYIITPGFVELGQETKLHHIELSKEIIKENVVPILVKSKNIKYMIEEFKENNYHYYYVKTFKRAFNLFLRIKGENACLLIENDLPDIY